MKLLYLTGTFLFFTLASCSIIESSEFHKLSQESSAGQIEATSPPSHIYKSVETIRDEITKKLQLQNEYYLTKLETLGAACRNSQEVIIYNNDAYELQDPRLSKLVKVMSASLTEMEGIVMEELNGKLENVSLLISQRMVNQISPLMDKIAELESQVQAIATNETVTQISSVMSAILKSKDVEISDTLLTIASMDQMIDMYDNFTNILNSISPQGQDVKSCEVEHLFDGAAKISHTLKNESARVKDDIKHALTQMKIAATSPIEELLQQVLTMAKENGAAISLLSDATAEIEPQTTGRLDFLKDALERASTVPTTEEPQPSIQEEQAIQNRDLSSEPRPCQDFHFVAACSAAIRFKKCYLKSVAFHCCRSCVDAGLISAPPTHPQ